ncbi:type II toxin-antitoxin system RelE/ParE family toxin [Brumimicrobium sp.]|uniref:type II toxin-antitoxin system RelE/ParE family toxin n=1 Tax=Brumimicrobium sp. TaxID=2029867 RepID=UPI003A95D7DF
MAFRVRLSIDAHRELKKAKCFYEAMDKKMEFLIDFDEHIEFLEQNPHLFQICYRNVRIVHFKIFPYSLHYNIIDGTVTVLNIIRQSQSF